MIEIGGMKVPFLSSIVTVSFAHFIKNLPGEKESVCGLESEPCEGELSLCPKKASIGGRLT
jgi:hypothetical protein